jgi:hypothetical protein
LITLLVGYLVNWLISWKVAWLVSWLIRLLTWDTLRISFLDSTETSAMTPQYIHGKTAVLSPLVPVPLEKNVNTGLLKKKYKLQKNYFTSTIEHMATCYI